MALQRTGVRLDDATVPATPITEQRPIYLVRNADRFRYCGQFVGRTVRCTVLAGRNRYTSVEGALREVVMDVGRNQAMLLVDTGQMRQAVFVGHLAAFHPQPAAVGQ